MNTAHASSHTQTPYFAWICALLFLAMLGKAEAASGLGAKRWQRSSAAVMAPAPTAFDQVRSRKQPARIDFNKLIASNQAKAKSRSRLSRRAKAQPARTPASTAASARTERAPRPKSEESMVVELIPARPLPAPP